MMKGWVTSLFYFLNSMRIFNCPFCGHVVFFDSLQCMHCHSELFFMPEQLTLAALQPAQAPVQDGLWQPRQTQTEQAAAPDYTLYKACAHRQGLSLCNFAIAGNDPSPLCLSCRQTSWLPDPSMPDNELRWARIERAKRHLFYTLSELALGPRPGHAQPNFALLADQPGQPAILTGHAGGTITLNVIEADDDERAKRRLALKEPFRTLAGHLRHEVGHFFWDQLVAGTAWQQPFRALFGDERQDYGQALQDYYARDWLDQDWQTHYISAYATSLPWEDWAETWAHYLHMIDLLETAASYGSRIQLPAALGAEAETVTVHDPFGVPAPDFDQMLREWGPLTLLVNSLSRSLGHDDAYPFAISWGVRRKLEFIHQIVSAQRQQAQS